MSQNHPLVFTTVSQPAEVAQILALQAENHPSVLSAEVQAREGFVTVQHDPQVLARMNRAHPSVIAKAADALAGYCLMMPREFRTDIPILEPMFQRLDQLNWRGQSLQGQRWFVMGQVCVAAGFRGQGVFDGMYEHLGAVYRDQFDFVITEVAERNTRSMRAHERVGFRTLYQYNSPLSGDSWRVIVWEF
jgi:hypothetical protein